MIGPGLLLIPLAPVSLAIPFFVVGLAVAAYGAVTYNITALSYMQATLEALGEEMARDPKIFVMGEGIGKRGGNFNTTAGLFDKYPGPRRAERCACYEVVAGFFVVARSNQDPVAGRGPFDGPLQ